MATGDKGVDAFLNAWNSLPQNYVPQYDFAYSENDGGLYAFPASPYKQAQYGSRFTGEPVWRSSDDNLSTPTSQALATGAWPGAERIDGSATIDPKYAQDLGIWQQMIQAGNATDDSFKGPVANIFGNSFTLPALFAAGMMGANAFPGVSAPGTASEGVDAAGGIISGGGGVDTLGAGAGGASWLKTGLMFAPAALSLGGTLAQMAGAGGSSSDPSSDGSTDAILKQGRELAQRTIPLQMGNLLDSLAKLRARARGSTAEILPDVMDSIQGLRQQYGDASAALSRKLGYAGGGQVEQGKSQLLAGAANQYARLINKGQQAGVAGLINTEGGFQPALSGAARPPSTSVSTGPANLTNYGTSVASLLSMAKELKAAKQQQQYTPGLEYLQD